MAFQHQGHPQAVALGEHHLVMREAEPLLVGLDAHVRLHHGRAGDVVHHPGPPAWSRIRQMGQPSRGSNTSLIGMLVISSLMGSHAFLPRREKFTLSEMVVFQYTEQYSIRNRKKRRCVSDDGDGIPRRGEGGGGGALRSAQTLDCGQCFLLRPDGGRRLVGAAGGHAAGLRFEGESLVLEGATAAEFEGFWRDYLDLGPGLCGRPGRLCRDPGGPAWRSPRYPGAETARPLSAGRPHRVPEQQRAPH